MIPKIIHYCWLSNDPIPADMQRYIESWKKFLPDYEFMLWNFSRFDINSSDWVKEAFKNKKYAFAADYIRLYALYNYGGIYMDMDVEVLKSFNPFLELDTMICYENGKSGLEMATFGVQKGASWIGKCLEYYKDRHFVKDDGMFDMVTLPFLIQNICLKDVYELKPVSTIEEAKKVDAEYRIPVFPSEYFSPKSSFRSEKITITENTVSIHHFTGTWLPWYSKIEKKMCNKLGFDSPDFFRSLVYKIQLEMAKRRKS